MTTAQKVIKYAAIAFAVFLVVSIVGGVISALSFIGDLLDGGTDRAMEHYSVSGSVRRLNLEVGAADLEIRAGDAFDVESNLENLTVEVKDGTLFIQEERRFWHVGSIHERLILTVPESFIFERIDFVTGAGRVTVDELRAGNLKMELGAGEVKINRLCAEKSAQIKGGAGSVRISGGEMNNLDFDMGVGELKFKSKLSGSCDFHMGVGSSELTLIGEKSDYSLKIHKGVGEAKVSGNSVGDGYETDGGSTVVKVDGGVGSFRIDFAKE